MSSKTRFLKLFQLCYDTAQYIFWRIFWGPTVIWGDEQAQYQYVSTFISFSMISLCSDTMANTLKKILVLAIIFPILTTLIWISSDFCVHSYPKVLKCSPINDSDKISATKIPLLPIPPLEITDSKFLSTFKKKHSPKRTSSPYILSLWSHYPLSRIPLKSANEFTTQIPPYDGPVIPFPRPG